MSSKLYLFYKVIHKREELPNFFKKESFFEGNWISPVALSKNWELGIDFMFILSDKVLLEYNLSQNLKIIGLRHEK